MKRVGLISINPPYTTEIFNEDKDIEWRKNCLPFGKNYVYETKKNGGCGKVIGEIEISGNHIYRRGETVPERYIRRGCVSVGDLKKYVGDGDKAKLVANFIGNVFLYDEPRPLSDFGLSRPPQSWCHVLVD